MIAGRLNTAYPMALKRDRPDLSRGIPLVAALGLAFIVASLVATTSIGSGDYGQWLMVSRGFAGAATPDYRSLSDVPPLVPSAIALLAGVFGDPVAALHAIGFILVFGMGCALYAAGVALDRRPTTGLVAAALGLLVTDRYLELLAFGGLLQAAAIIGLTLAVTAFSRAHASTTSRRRWWVAGCVALFITCLTHVPTATIALPVCLAAAAVGASPGRGEPIVAWLRAVGPLIVGFAAVGVYWVAVIAPASLGFVTNPASLSYRGPERVFELLLSYPPTLAIVVLGLGGLMAWLVRLAVRRRLPGRRDPRAVLLIWTVVSWAAFGYSAMVGVSTDYPRFVPLLLTPLVIAAAGLIGVAGAAFVRRAPRRFNGERGVVAIGLAIALVAPFSIANFQGQARGYRLTDDRALAEAAAWADARLIPGAAILAPVREAKWIEGFTGRSALFSSQVRYAVRPIEWQRSLAAAALMRANLALANESFVLTMTDGVETSTRDEPRTLLVAANHGGEYVDLLRLVPASSLVLDGNGHTLASLPALAPAGFEDWASAQHVEATTRWAAVRPSGRVEYTQTIGLDRGSTSFSMDVRAESELPIGGLELEFRPPTGVAMVDVKVHGAIADVTFARMGRTKPTLRLNVKDGQIVWTPTGGLLVRTTAASLSLTLTDLTAGGASSSLRILDPAALIADYGVGAAILRRDPAYEARRDRLERLGFHVVHVAGPYVVMIRTGAARPATR